MTRNTDSALPAGTIVQYRKVGTFRIGGVVSGNHTANDEHTGRPLVRRTDWGRIMILCPEGHVYQTVAEDAWAGSEAETRCADPSYTVTCRGAVAS